MVFGFVGHVDDFIARARACIFYNFVVLILVLLLLRFFVLIGSVLIRASFSPDRRRVIPPDSRRRLLLLLYFLRIINSRSVLPGIKGYFLPIDNPAISLNLVILIRVEQTRSNVLFGSLVF